MLLGVAGLLHAAVALPLTSEETVATPTAHADQAVPSIDQTFDNSTSLDLVAKVTADIKADNYDIVTDTDQARIDSNLENSTSLVSKVTADIKADNYDIVSDTDQARIDTNIENSTSLVAKVTDDIKADNYDVVTDADQEKIDQHLAKLQETITKLKADLGDDAK